jgi:hypothetical protein
MAAPAGTGIARDQRYSWALGPVTPSAIIRCWAARGAAHTRRARRFAIVSYRRLAWGAAATLLMLAAPAAFRWLTRIHRSPVGLATQPGTAPDEKPPLAAPPNDQSVAPPEKVTVTPAGVRIVDRRKVPGRLVTAEQRGAEAADEPAQRQAAEETRRAAWWRRAAGKAYDALWFPMLGKLIRAGRRTPLPVVSDADLGRYAWRQAACRQLLRDKPGRAGYPSELIALAADETAGDWRLPVVWWVKRHVPPAEFTRLVQIELVGPGHAALADRRLTLLLRLAGQAAAALPDGDARAVIRTALACARKPVDPYSGNELTLVSRSVVSVLLEQRPELDDVVLRILELQAGESRMGPDVPLPVEARLLAFAIRDRTPDFGGALSRAAVRAGLGPAQLEAAARLADAPLARPPHLHAAKRTPAPLAAAGLIIARGLPWLAPVAVAAGVGAATHLARWAPAHTEIALGDSIALLVVLATVNVFTVQLSASRLPGVVARSAGQPWELFSSYSAVLTLLGLSAFRARAAWLVAASSWAALAALLLFSASLLAAMFRLLRRTDAGRAAGGYVARTLPMARAAGRRLGRIQANAVEMREALETVPAVRTSPDAVAGEWSQNIAARTRGFFMPSRARMRRLLAHDAFVEGMLLRVLAGLGTIIGRGEDIASLIPARDQTITRALARQAGRTLRTRSCRRVEDVATGAVALTQMAIDLANAGDIGTARTVTQNVARLVAEHTAAARRARTQAFQRQALRASAAASGGLRSTAQSAQASMRARDTEFVPVIPALRDSLRVAVRGRLESRQDLFNVPEAVIEPLLSSSGPAEAAVIMLTASVPTDADQANAGPGAAAELLRIAGIRALELRNSTAFGQVLDRLDRLSRSAAETSDAPEVTGVLAASACRFDVRLSQRAIDHALGQLAASPADAANVTSLAPLRRLIILWRAGAAGLACGAISVAVYAAQRLFQLGEQDSLDSMVSDQGLVAREALRSNLRGGYLGDQAEDALANFGTFLKSLAPVLGEPAAGAATPTNSP